MVGQASYLIRVPIPINVPLMRLGSVSASSVSLIISSFASSVMSCRKIIKNYIISTFWRITLVVCVMCFKAYRPSEISRMELFCLMHTKKSWVKCQFTSTVWIHDEEMYTLGYCLSLIIPWYILRRFQRMWKSEVTGPIKLRVPHDQMPQKKDSHSHPFLHGIYCNQYS